MDLDDGERIALGDAGGEALVLPMPRRAVRGEVVLKAHLAEMAKVPADDVELALECPICGARHGRPTVAYPTTPSGAPWYADVAVAGDLVVTVVGKRHPLGAAIESSELAIGAVIDEAAFHALERAALDALDPQRRALVRSSLWARKTALLRAVGHTDFIEPSRLAVSIPGADGGLGFVERAVPELGAAAAGARFHDLPVPGARTAAVAVLPPT